MKNTQLSGNESEESLYLTHCLQLIEHKTGWGNAPQWTQSNYERLREQIAADSGTTISCSTLRRLFMQPSARRRHPQIATRNALAAFAGYHDWDEFVRQQSLDFPAPIAERLTPTLRRNRNRVRIRWAVVITGAVAGLLYYHLFASHRPNVVLTGHQNWEKSSQVVFDYDLSSLNADSIQIDFGDGDIQGLSKFDRQTVHEYTVPSVHRVRLIADNEPLTSIMVRKPTQGWDGNVLFEDSLWHSLSEFRQPDRLYASPESVYQGAPVSNPVYWTTYYNVHDFGVDGDGFEVEARVKNDSLEGGISCYDVTLNVICEQGWVVIKFMKPDCTVWSDLIVGEVKRDGKKDDLSAFGQDFSYWRTIRAKVLDHRLLVSLDGEPIYKPVSYKQSLGPIQGVGLAFKGSGSVDYVKLSVVLLDKVPNL